MNYNLCIIKPNKSVYSETFIQNHIDYLQGNKIILYGGNFPLYKEDGSFLISSKFDLLLYLFQKRILKHNEIRVRNKALSQFLKRNRIDVVLAEYGMVGASICKACKLVKVPLIIHFHGADAHHYETVNKYIKQYKEAFEYASAIIAVSQFMLNKLIQLGAPKDKIFLNPYGVDLNKFTNSSPEVSSNTLFFAGRFVEKKAPQVLIKAFGIVKKSVPNAKLIMAGNGPLLEDSKLLAKKLNLNIEFPGVYSHQQVKEKMQMVRGFVQHSVIATDGDAEGTPNSILEASASGLPVISTFHAGISEAVIDKKTGLLSNENDIEAFANNMITILKDGFYAKELGVMGAKHISEHYNLKLRILALDKIIQNSLKYD